VLYVYFSVTAMKPNIGYDDALDVFGIHGLAGIMGAILTGVFADPSVNEAVKDYYMVMPNRF